MHKSSKDTNRETMWDDNMKDDDFLSEASSSSTAPPTPATSVRAATTSTASGLVLFPVLGLGCVVDEESVKGQGVWEDEVADVVAADGQGV